MKGFLGRLSETLRGAEKITKLQAAPGPASAPVEYVKSALAHHGAGRLAEAEALYRKALAVDAENFDALHLLGVVRQQTGDNANAVELIERAISLAPENPSAHSNLGLAYRALNRLDDADACFAKAVQLNPSSTEALNNLGNIRKERNQFSDAEALYRRALAIDPAALAIWKNLGQVLQLSDRTDDAIECYERVLAIRSDDATALVEIGTICATRGELPAAEHNFRLALQTDAKLFDAMRRLGDVLVGLDRLDEAEQHCRNALAIRPDDPDALNSLASVLLRNSKLDEAEARCRRALSLRRDHAPTQMTMGYILDARERPGEAEECFRTAMRLTSNGAAARYNLSILKLLRGDYKEGLELYESRFGVLQRHAGRAPAIRELLADNRRWQGERLRGQRLLVWAEQGFGDSLMMLRYLPMLKARGAGQIVVLCERALERVVCSIRGLEGGVSSAQMVSADDFDLHCPIMSLPFLFDTTLDTVPGSIPYISIPKPLGDVWRKRLSALATRKVGLAWAGSKILPYDARRSIPLSAFAPLMDQKDVTLISLQKGDGAEQLGAWRGRNRGLDGRLRRLPRYRGTGRQSRSRDQRGHRCGPFGGRIGKAGVAAQSLRE